MKHAWRKPCREASRYQLIKGNYRDKDDFRKLGALAFLFISGGKDATRSHQ